MNKSPDERKPHAWFGTIAPGVLIAATGVGAGDLLTGGLAGSAVGVAIVWAVCVGAVLKWFLTEGVARWQMATDTTLLKGWLTHLGRWVAWVFIAYLLVWSFFTGGALISACGVAATGMWPIGSDLGTSKVVWGIVHSLVGLAFVLVGGFRLFERIMSVCVGLMFITVISTALLIRPDWRAIGHGLVSPSIPAGGGFWILGLIGGVGGTVTLLSYGYWIREAGRHGASGVRSCRIDLAIGYTMTALFGVAMVVIGANAMLTKGPTVALDLASQLGSVVGPFGKWLFLIGFWGAVFSSLLGVWQSIPYLFADFLAIHRGSAHDRTTTVEITKTRGYRAYLVALAIVPLPMLGASVKTAQLSYAIIGSLFMPLLALTLLIMNNKSGWVGRAYRNGWVNNLALIATLLFFAYVAGDTAYRKLGALLNITG